jgi:hypothetical protein
VSAAAAALRRVGVVVQQRQVPAAVRLVVAHRAEHVCKRVRTRQDDGRRRSCQRLALPLRAALRLARASRAAGAQRVLRRHVARDRLVQLSLRVREWTTASIAVNMRG